MLLLFVVVVWQFWQIFFVGRTNASQLQNFNQQENRILLFDGGLHFQINSRAETVADFLSEQKINLSEHDQVYPHGDVKINGSMRIIIQRAKKITIKENKKTSNAYTLQNTIEQALWENKDIVLGEDDVTAPARNMPVKNEMTIVVTHVLIKEEIKNLDIEYKTISNEDDKLGWRVRKVTQKGEEGTKEVKYRVVYNDGKEISRKVLESNIIKDPVEEIVTQGTYVKVGKPSRGDASYYASGWGALNASRSIPRGGYAKVTNMDNGKSVIVKINDFGPQSPQRIIDLDYVSFSKIADLGQGIAHNVKVEQVLN
ncbi:MAG: hypothetical protein US25_C0004G0015 [Candidatus Moranbacteria bacterium GW2011_GWE1_36_7]|nr:MAG: hypothetical protein UR99_C0001G0015 [Candidatus Moranbacteria bacterium GW2011_GWD2_36_12]KKQ07179.1 MAG: hypothetical protein US16_C0001G0015 [Candidatus Moranbacteria bacterium GW2011_GWE2_36_40]KKQ15467.1 MAG: hypothetical protein US25_C0004G0015 [Candidatus Moranbacteria bacterium GW2011_GWE1_36_7]